MAAQPVAIVPGHNLVHCGSYGLHGVSQHLNGFEATRGGAALGLSESVNHAAPGAYQPEDFKSRARGATMQKILNFFRDNSGVTSIEYTIMASLIAMAIIIGVSLLGQAVGNFFTNVANEYPN
jgi:pilus assembly protein Flp/PilA